MYRFLRALPPEECKAVGMRYARNTQGDGGSPRVHRSHHEHWLGQVERQLAGTPLGPNPTAVGARATLGEDTSGKPPHLWDTPGRAHTNRAGRGPGPPYWIREVRSLWPARPSLINHPNQQVSSQSPMSTQMSGRSPTLRSWSNSVSSIFHKVAWEGNFRCKQKEIA